MKIFPETLKVIELILHNKSLCFKESLDIKNNGTIMVIGEVEQLIIPENAIVNNDIDLELTNSVGISGLNSYYTLKKIETHPYARVEQVPKF